MFKSIILAFVVVVSVLSGNSFAAQNDLAGLVVVIDPGHGGSDPGSSGYFSASGGKKVRVTENEYCYDVALRLQRMLIAKGATVKMTVVDKKQVIPVAKSPRDVIVDNMDETFALDGTRAYSEGGLYKRTAYANAVNRVYGFRQKIVFISIHFDSLGNSCIEGIRIIDAKRGTRIGQLLESESRGSRRANNRLDCRMESGDKAHGLRNLHVLSGYNSIKNKSLVELGNFKNTNDVWRIRDYRVRENYAQLITRALVRFNSVQRHS